jgi:hypothetical protein
VSRFGVHLIQVIERRKVSLDPKQQREQARNVLREQKFDQAYWTGCTSCAPAPTSSARTPADMSAARRALPSKDTLGGPSLGERGAS